MNQVTSSLNLSPSKHNDNNFNQITTLINKSRYILSFSNSNVEIIRFISYFKNEVCNNIDLIAPQSIEAIEVNEIWNLFSLLELREELNFADAYCKANKPIFAINSYTGIIDEVQGIDASSNILYASYSVLEIQALVNKAICFMLLLKNYEEATFFLLLAKQKCLQYSSICSNGFEEVYIDIPDILKKIDLSLNEAFQTSFPKPRHIIKYKYEIVKGSSYIQAPYVINGELGRRTNCNIESVTMSDHNCNENYREGQEVQSNILYGSSEKLEIESKIKNLIIDENKIQPVTQVINNLSLLPTTHENNNIVESGSGIKLRNPSVSLIFPFLTSNEDSCDLHLSSNCLSLSSLLVDSTINSPPHIANKSYQPGNRKNAGKERISTKGPAPLSVHSFQNEIGLSMPPTRMISLRSPPVEFPTVRCGSIESSSSVKPMKRFDINYDKEGNCAIEFIKH